MTTENICQRSDLLGTQVITRDTGKRLGVVSQLWVDIDRRTVVALGVRDNILAVTALPRYMRLSEISQIGDVILVEDDDVIEDDLDVEGYSNLIRSEVITETGELLGQVRGFKFNTEDGTVVSIIIASVGIPQIPESVLSTYELPIEEVVSSGPNRLIVFEGAQERLSQISMGILERLNLSTPPWEREEDYEFGTPVARPENQLDSGIRTPAQEPLQAPARPVQESRWDEDQWDRPEPEPLYEEEPEVVYAEYEEEDNWSEASRAQYAQPYEDAPYTEAEVPEKAQYPEYAEYDEYEDIEADAWADEEDPKTYKAPKVNLPKKTKMPEYEEETGY